MDMTGTVPFATPGLLEMDWWPEIFFMVFRAPYPGKQYVFKNGDPIASYLIVPRNVKYDIVRMSEEEENLRTQRQQNLETYWNRICTRVFYCEDGEEFFDNKYKYLSGVARRDGNEVVGKYMDNPKLIEHWDTEKTIVDHRPEDKQVCQHATRPNDGKEFPDPATEGSLSDVDELINKSANMDDADLDKLVIAFKKQRRRNRMARSHKLRERCDKKMLAKFQEPDADVKLKIEEASQEDWILGHKLERIK
jgi:hypothetical protein